jgi:hypothetical protein
MVSTIVLNPLLPTRTIYQYPSPTWIENVAVRSNGQLLLSFVTTPELHLLDPSTSPPTSTLVHRFSEVLALTGIIEVSPDKFYIAGGNFNLSTFDTAAGSYVVFELDLPPPR